MYQDEAAIAKAGADRFCSASGEAGVLRFRATDVFCGIVLGNSNSLILPSSPTMILTIDKTNRDRT